MYSNVDLLLELFVEMHSPVLILLAIAVFSTFRPLVPTTPVGYKKVISHQIIVTFTLHIIRNYIKNVLDYTVHTYLHYPSPYSRIRKKNKRMSQEFCILPATSANSVHTDDEPIQL